MLGQGHGQVARAVGDPGNRAVGAEQEMGGVLEHAQRVGQVGLEVVQK